MHTVELLEQMIAVAERLGYRTRMEWLGGTGGGACELRGSKWLFVDLALTTSEQLEQVAATLQADPALYVTPLPAGVREALGLRRAA